MPTNALESHADSPDVPSPVAGSPRLLSPWRSRLRRLAGLTVLGTLGILGLLWFVGVFGGNVREVWPGRFYRSAQLTGHNLEDTLAAHHIGSIINLRGANTDSAWYWDEAGICKKRGVEHFDVSMSATRLPDPIEMRKLIADLDTAHYPVIVHCMGGADRSGLVSALYLALYQHVPVFQAEHRELTWRYGHLSWTKSRKMDQFFDLYRQFGDGMDFRRWILDRYPAIFSRETGK